MPVFAKLEALRMMKAVYPASDRHPSQVSDSLTLIKNEINRIGSLSREDCL